METLKYYIFGLAIAQNKGFMGRGLKAALEYYMQRSVKVSLGNFQYGDTVQKKISLLEAGRISEILTNLLGRTYLRTSQAR